MRKYEYDGLLRAVDDLKKADAAFNHSYIKGEITEEQPDLYERPKYQLDEIYRMADMVLINYKTEKMLREWRCRPLAARLTRTCDKHCNQMKEYMRKTLPLPVQQHCCR